MSEVTDKGIVYVKGNATAGWLAYWRRAYDAQLRRVYFTTGIECMHVLTMPRWPTRLALRGPWLRRFWAQPLAASWPWTPLSPAGPDRDANQARELRR